MSTTDTEQSSSDAAALAASRQEIDALRSELEETNRGVRIRTISRARNG